MQSIASKIVIRLPCYTGAQKIVLRHNTTLQPLPISVIGAQQGATCKVLHQKLLLDAPVTQGQKNWALGHVQSIASKIVIRHPCYTGAQKIVRRHNTTLQPLPISVIGAQQGATCKVLHQKLLLDAHVTQGHKYCALGHVQSIASKIVIRRPCYTGAQKLCLRPRAKYCIKNCY